MRTLFLILTLFLVSCTSTYVNKDGYERPNWTKSKSTNLHIVVALDGSRFYSETKSSFYKIGGFDYSAEILYSENGAQLNEPEVKLVPINKKIALGCTPTEGKFYKCNLWDLTKSSPSATAAPHIAGFHVISSRPSTSDTKTITSVRVLEFAGTNNGQQLFNLKLINSEMAEVAKVEAITGYTDKDKFLEVEFANATKTTVPYEFKSASIDAAKFQVINGRAVKSVVNSENLYQFIDEKTGALLPLPVGVIGYEPMENSTTLFATAIMTANGIRYKYESKNSPNSLICRHIRSRTYFNIGAKAEVVLCKTESSQWTAIEIQNLQTSAISPITTPPTEKEDDAVKLAGNAFENKKSEDFQTEQSAKCMQVYIGERDKCFLSAGDSALSDYLLKQEKPNIDTMATAIQTKYFPDSTKKSLEQKYLAMVLNNSNVSSYHLTVAIKNPNLTAADKNTLQIKWATAYTGEVQAAKEALRKCIKTANTWKSIRERGCARELGGEEWFAWLEKDHNAPSKDFEAAIAAAKKNGRSTAKLEETYKFVKRSESDDAYYAEKDRREREEKAAFGNLSKIFEQARNGFTALCAQLPQNCNAENFKTNSTWRPLSFEQKRRLEESQKFLEDYVRRNP